MRHGGTVSNRIFGFLISCNDTFTIHVFLPHLSPCRLAQLGESGSSFGEEFRLSETEGEIRLWVSERRL